MAICNYCKKTVPNGKHVHYKCTNCNTVWCNDGNCNGSSGTPQRSRSGGSMCMACKKAGYLVKV